MMTLLAPCFIRSKPCESPKADEHYNFQNTGIRDKGLTHLLMGM